MGVATDAGMRLALRLAYGGLRAWWFLRRPAHEGAVVAIWHRGRILMLRHSYRARLGWPGGSIGRGETPSEAARRELREELDLEVADGALTYVGETLQSWEYRRDRVRIFELTLPAAPHLRLDRREVVGAEFMTPAAALAADIAPFIRGYLEGRPPPS
jgi:8-oxo-dGTP pyrophosphatase MutT (NUDIX family)